MGELMGTIKSFFAGVRRVVNNAKFMISATMQGIFFAYYGYCLYTNFTLERRAYFILYACLAVLAVFGFGRDVYVFAVKKTKNRQLSRMLKFFKLVSNGAMIVVNIVSIFHYGINNGWEVLMLIGSIFLWIVQVIFELTITAIQDSVDCIKSTVQSIAQIGGGDVEKGFSEGEECVRSKPKDAGNITIVSEKVVEDE